MADRRMKLKNRFLYVTPNQTLKGNGYNHRRIISIKEKAKVAAAACLTECIQVLAVLAS